MPIINNVKNTRHRSSALGRKIQNNYPAARRYIETGDGEESRMRMDVCRWIVHCILQNELGEEGTTMPKIDKMVGQFKTLHRMQEAWLREERRKNRSNHAKET